jgi:alkylation response protein AidB-like acyl-CoA dehydrogenase
MDFDLTEEQSSIQKAAEEFARGEFDKEIALECEKGHRFPREILKKAAELGFIGIHYPEEYGGQGYGVFENVLVVEALCRQDSGLGIALACADSSAEMILRFGSDEQKRRYLPSIARGEAISSGAFTEPDSGSDLTGLSTTAVRKGADFVINGSKMFITNGPVCDFVVVLCQTDPSAVPLHHGQSVFVVEKEAPGFTASDVGEKMGNKMVATGELSFNDVKVPESSLVGKENDGFQQSLALFNELRIEVAAQGLGIAQGCLDRVVDYVKTRKQFRRKLSDFQATQHKLADMAAMIEAARTMVYKAAWSFDRGTCDPYLISIAKLTASQTAVRVADEAIQLHGGYGYMLEYDMERFYRDARLTAIYAGTTEIQKNTIADELLR